MTAQQQETRKQTRTERIAEGVALANPTGEQVREILDLMRQVDPSKLNDDMRKWAAQHIGHVYAGTSDLEQSATEQARTASSLKEQAEQAHERKRELDQQVAERKKFVCVMALWTCKTAKLMSQDDLASVWGVSKGYVSKWIKAAEAAAVLKTNDAKSYQRLTTYASKAKAAEFNAAVHADGASIATVAESLDTQAAKAAEARRQREAEKLAKQAEGLPQETAEMLSRVVKNLVHLNKTGDAVDVSKLDEYSTADELFRELAHAVKAYSSKHVPSNGSKKLEVVAA